MVTMRRIPLLLEPFGIEAIEYQALTLRLTPGEFVARAALHHVGSPPRAKDASFLGEAPVEPRALTVALDPDSWATLEAEAFDAGINVAQLLARASLALAADIDSGRVAGQIV
jgi:hypothetical protein